MLTVIRQYFSVVDVEIAEKPSLELAAAALLVEVARADHQVDEDEEQAIAQLLEHTLNLGADEVESIIELAHEHSRDAVGLHSFTSVVHDRFDAQEKVLLFECLWRVAFADGSIDKYEEHMLRRIAELLHVPHRDFIRTKLRVQSELT